MNKVLLILIVNIILRLSALAQESFNVGGGNSKEGNLSISYSIGQTFFQPFTSYGGIIKTTPGVQQAYTIEVANNLENPTANSIDIKLYPNPVSEYLELSISDYKSLQCLAYLIDNNGKVIAIYPVQNSELHIAVSVLIPGIYFLKVVDGDSILKVFKVVKK